MAHTHDDADSVISVFFEDDSHAYDGLTILKELDSQGQIDLQGAAVVARDETGEVEIKDEIGDTGYAGTATGGLIGLIVGIIGGPLGILIGGATGVLIGSLFDIEDSDDTESVLGEISLSVRQGRTALLAEVHEPSPEVIETAMEAIGGVVIRRLVGDVETEIAATEQAQRAAKKEARKQLHEARREEREDKIHAKVQELKAKLPGRKKTSA